MAEHDIYNFDLGSLIAESEATDAFKLAQFAGDDGATDVVDNAREALSDSGGGEDPGRKAKFGSGLKALSQFLIATKKKPRPRLSTSTTFRGGAPSGRQLVAQSGTGAGQPTRNPAIDSLAQFLQRGRA